MQQSLCSEAASPIYMIVRQPLMLTHNHVIRKFQIIRSETLARQRRRQIACCGVRTNTRVRFASLILARHIGLARVFVFRSAVRTFIMLVRLSPKGISSATLDSISAHCKRS